MDYKALMEAHEKNMDEFVRDTGIVPPGRDIPAAVGTGPKTEILYRQGAWDVWVTMLKRKADKADR